MPNPASSSAALPGSFAAPASLRKIASANSPAAFRVNVSATILSGSAPPAISPMIRSESRYVFPDPAEASTSRFFSEIFIGAFVEAWWLAVPDWNQG